jgi:hypothetical protein
MKSGHQHPGEFGIRLPAEQVLWQAGNSEFACPPNKFFGRRGIQILNF